MDPNLITLISLLVTVAVVVASTVWSTVVVSIRVGGALEKLTQITKRVDGIVAKLESLPCETHTVAIKLLNYRLDKEEEEGKRKDAI